MNTSEHEREHDHVIEVTDLRRVYGGDFEAVRGITFSVERGELFALLGTNGAGKTSTVELLEGLAAPSGGRVRVLGHDPYEERAAVRPRTGVMLQEGGFPSELTVAETVRMWAGCTSGARPVGEALSLVGLERRPDVRVKQLSGGERRRLDLALALLGRPEVLFLDEPTTGLDAEGRQETWELVRELRDGGTTVLLTTHYLEEAEGLADRLAILHEGRIATAGTPAEVTAAQPSRISFDLPDGYFLGDLPPLADLGVSTHETTGRTVRLRTHELQRTATALLLWAQRAQVELRGLDVRSASLEEAFLRIAREAAGDRPGRPGRTDVSGTTASGKEAVA
ncbi:multidrug ABC transporter ATP-binding protein [Streptomyces avermitilis]|uniref:ABC transporter ATP-binding protein n=2 Tax=Streptomyces avermitilis TaxID=33903 RepID=Q82FW0_STRAW|nr:MULTISPECIES: ATP-binding cassette domain-containing protein [Streptomyces]KUN52735.1 multidrug ABC transporter ATP-binding protein [Streptomyces avermitilis]MYS99731.1 ATP-binding cassette domain-containing protein [Streptomyces sp. SID5469]OOV32034.1 multidrug ABC transporter ATP-binding protein [Streptomyces avermitilis]BAC71854.1 putative ABC transporter ATP-binding protein [Streptomyces avermitilis MA-4680 = NBRC 14893]GDY64155.1 multidrug ABC transporter ATP-binding protein [Streptomy